MNYREILENTLKQFIDRKCDKADMDWLRNDLESLILTAKREAVRQFAKDIFIENEVEQSLEIHPMATNYYKMQELVEEYLKTIESEGKDAVTPESGQGKKGLNA